MRLDHALGRISSRYADKTAVEVCGESSISFTELERRSDAVAGFLRDSGVRPGDRVGILSRHDPDAVVVFWATLKASAIAVWLNDDAGGGSLSSIVADATPVLVFAQSDRHQAMLESVAGDYRLVRLAEISNADESGNSVARIDTDEDSDAIAAIVYTSGSSGRPKGVCLTHRNLWTVVRAVIQHMPITDADSYMMVVPMHYVHGLMQLLVHTLVGATIYCCNSFAFPKKVTELLRTTAVTGFSGVPFHFNMLASRGGFLDADLPDLKWLTVTGGKLANSRLLQIMDHLPQVRFHIAYGQTECAPRATALDPDKLRRKPDSVGSAIPGVQVLLLNDDGKNVATGETGEVVIEGDNVMKGYWDDPAGTAEVLDSQGRLLTGDLGRFDEDGDLFLVGRKSAMIKSAGERIVPEELENILTSNRLVDDAVVVGVADDLYGQRVVAHLLLSEESKGMERDVLIAEVRSHCLASIPFARAPRDYQCWDEFPRKANGKPDRGKIAEVNESDE